MTEFGFVSWSVTMLIWVFIGLVWLFDLLVLMSVMKDLLLCFWFGCLSDDFGLCPLIVACLCA